MTFGCPSLAAPALGRKTAYDDRSVVEWVGQIQSYPLLLLRFLLPQDCQPAALLTKENLNAFRQAAEGLPSGWRMLSVHRVLCLIFMRLRDASTPTSLPVSEKSACVAGVEGCGDELFGVAKAEADFGRLVRLNSA